MKNSVMDGTLLSQNESRYAVLGSAMFDMKNENLMPMHEISDQL